MCCYTFLDVAGVYVISVAKAAFKIILALALISASPPFAASRLKSSGIIKRS